MKRNTLTVLTAVAALAATCVGETAAWAETAEAPQSVQAPQAGSTASRNSTAQAKQLAAPGDAASSMAKPPEAASGSTGSSNPDNMPIKRPRKPTNDKMMHEPPASGANAK
jgi:hypothetical protein